MRVARRVRREDRGNPPGAIPAGRPDPTRPDNGTNWYFQGSAYPQWPDALVSLLKQVPAMAFQAVDESCLMVAPDSGEARAKPGCPVG